MYPVELFPKKPHVVELQDFNPRVGDIIDFKPNSALSAGTNVFLSGYWRRGIIIDIEIDDAKGKMYTVEDVQNKKIYCLTKYLIRPNMLH